MSAPAQTVVSWRPTGRTLAGAAVMPLVLVLFFLSGVSGLVYELVWLRYLTLVFGVTIYAVSTVLTAFMAGLALGGYLAGRVADRLRRPLQVYGLLELGIGLAALLTPPAFGLLDTVYRWLYPSLPADLTFVSLVRFVLACAILLVPTTLMGATLPVVVRSSLGRSAALGTNLSLLYASNTAGGIAGTYVAGFVLIGTLGIRATTTTAAVLNLSVGVLAIALDWYLGRAHSGADHPAVADGDRLPLPAGQGRGEGHRSPFASRSPHHNPGSPQVAGRPQGDGTSAPALGEGAAGPSSRSAPAVWPSRPVLRWLLVTLFVSGMTSLAYQVIWTRILAIFFEATTYAFTIILCTFLLGLAAGSYAIAPLVNRRANWLFVVAVLEWAIAVTALLSVAVISWLHVLVDALRTLPLFEHLVSGEQRATALMTFVTMFPTTVLLGAAFPIILRLYAGGGDHATAGAGTDQGLGRRVGRAYAANVCGSIVGSWAAGFVLIPLLGTHRSLVLLAFATVAVAVGLLWHACRPAMMRRFRVLAPVGVALAAGAVALTPDMYGAVFSRFGDRVLWYEEGLEQTVTILQGPTTRRMYLNGWHQANDTPSMLRLHELIGHLPLLLQPAVPARAERGVLVIGLGGGATAGAAAAHDRARLDVVELSPSVVRGARFFSHVNGGVVDAPNVTIRTDDGRNYLLLADQKYDVIMADALRPQHAGSSALYSLQYYGLARAALAEGGVMMQWIDRSIPENQYRLLLRTFLEAFPYVTAWADGTLFIGSERPYVLERQALQLRLAGSARGVLAPLGLTTPETVLQLFTATDAELRAYAGSGPVVSDDHPYVEFFRSLPHDPQPPDTARFRRDPSALVR